MDTFKDRLRLLRKEKRVTQAEMAALINCVPRHYQEIEYGHVNVPMSTLITLADYFDVSLDYLVGRSDVSQRR